MLYINNSSRSNLKPAAASFLTSSSSQQQANNVSRETNEFVGVNTPKDLMNNPLTFLETKFNELEDGFKGWLAKQSLPVEVAVVTSTSAAVGAVVGGFMGAFTKDSSASTFPNAPPSGAALSSQNMASSMQPKTPPGGPLIHARNYAVMMGVQACIHSVMRRLRGKEDVQTSMVAAFGSGVMFSFVSGMGGPNHPANVITTGVFFALVQGGVSKVGKKLSRPSADDAMYSETRAMLSRLGLENYEKNFKSGSLTDSTLPQLTDRALQDVRIPPGARLVILDHVQRNKEVKKGGRKT